MLTVAGQLHKCLLSCIEQMRIGTLILMDIVFRAEVE